jgi:hypothetical protein
MTSRSSPIEEGSDNSTVKMILGDIGLSILGAIRFGPIDPETIRLMCGAPRSCIEGRLQVLKEMELVREDERGFILSQGGIDVLSSCQ